MYRNILNKKGFTLIELLVVISIISMLASVVMASVNSARAKSKVAAGKTFANHTRSGLFDDAIILANFNNSTSCFDVLQGNMGKGVFSITCALPLASFIFAVENDTSLHNSGKYLRFEGSNPGQIVVTDSSGLLRNAIVSRNFTYSLWFKNIGGSCTNDYCVLLGSGAGADPVSLWIKYSDKTINAEIVPSSATAQVSVPFTSMLDWTHIAFSVNPTSVSIYINGKLEKSVPHTVASSAYDSVSNANLVSMLIGGAFTDFAADGYYDDVAVFGRSLVAGEVEQIYAQGLENRKLANN